MLAGCEIHAFFQIGKVLFFAYLMQNTRSMKPTRHMTLFKHEMTETRYIAIFMEMKIHYLTYCDNQLLIVRV